MSDTQTYRRVVVYIQGRGQERQVFWDHAWCTIKEAIDRCKWLCEHSWRRISRASNRNCGLMGKT